MIKIVKFREGGVQIGPDSATESYLTQDQVHHGYRLSLELCPKEQMLLVSGKHVAPNRSDEYFQWVPYTAVSTILLSHHPKASAEPVRKPQGK